MRESFGVVTSSGVKIYDDDSLCRRASPPLLLVFFLRHKSITALGHLSSCEMPGSRAMHNDQGCVKGCQQIGVSSGTHPHNITHLIAPNNNNIYFSLRLVFLFTINSAVHEIEISDAYHKLFSI